MVENNSNSILRRKYYLERQLDVFSEDTLKSSEIFSELQSIEHKLKKSFSNKTPLKREVKKTIDF